MPDDPSVTMYLELCKAYHAIRDFRAKLLALLPLASGGGVVLLLRSNLDTSPHYLIVAGAFGVVVTVGLYLYEWHNIRKCEKLICQGANLEEKLGAGQFQAHPLYQKKVGTTKKPYFTPHFFAAVLVYLAVVASWVYVVAVGVRLAVRG
jgi:quinol-cytochrome oxidoreductase complex cytochrome b subunit